jgi:hypothetical protein
MKSINCSIPGYTNIICSKIEHIPYNLIFTTKYNDSSILIRIISWDYLNLSLANVYVDDVIMPTQVIKYNQCCSRRISRSVCSIHIKLLIFFLIHSKSVLYTSSIIVRVCSICHWVNSRLFYTRIFHVFIINEIVAFVYLCSILI